jgi:hypothetical protein
VFVILRESNINTEFSNKIRDEDIKWEEYRILTFINSRKWGEVIDKEFEKVDEK